MKQKHSKKSGIVSRGDLYYIDIPCSTGHEMQKDRPGVVVSCDALNRTSTCVTVVMCSGSNHHDLPQHITIRSLPEQSTAMCEHIYTVDKSRLGRYLGRVTPIELQQIDIGLIMGLALDDYGLASPQTATKEQTEASSTACEVKRDYDAEHAATAIRLFQAEAERDAYHRMYDNLLDRVMQERRVSA